MTKLYLTNKALMAAIHESKLTYCSYVEPAHAYHDKIVNALSEITPELIEEVRKKKAKPRGKKDQHVDPATIPTESLVFRVMTFEHIPLAQTTRPRRGKNLEYEKVPFPAFKHYIVKDGTPIEVLRSHWQGGIENGWFSHDHGKIKNDLATMFMMLAERYGRRGNWRGYSYVDEMKAQAIVMLCQIGLQFDESKSENPFAYYTTTMRNSFTKVLNNEKKVQDIRDDLLIAAGSNPSHTRQFKDEWEARK